jgi:hypothetical protein
MTSFHNKRDLVHMNNNNNNVPFSIECSHDAAIRMHKLAQRVFSPQLRTRLIQLAKEYEQLTTSLSQRDLLP